MLAFMSPLPLMSEHYSPLGLSSDSTMSLAILPSSAPTSCRAQAAPSPVLMTSVNKAAKRPKLSLNTTGATTMFGKKSTSLRLETLSATSPTTLNTFSNGYTVEPTMPKSLSSRPPRLSLSISLTQNRPQTPEQSDDSPGSTTRDSASSWTQSTPSSFVTDSPSHDAPYKLPFNLTSILRNGPVPRPISYKLFTQPISPSSKKVKFRAPLTEDIVTTKYTAPAMDSDLSSSSSTISTLQLSSPDVQSPASNHSDDTSTSTIRCSLPSSSSSSPVFASSPLDREQANIGDKRESDDEHDGGSCPQTPIAGRRKRVRDWRWTLGSTDQHETSPSTAAEDGNNVDHDDE